MTDNPHLRRAPFATIGVKVRLADRRGWTKDRQQALRDAVLRRGEPFHDLGANYFDEHDREHVRRRLTLRLEALGYQVTVASAASGNLLGTHAETETEATHPLIPVQTASARPDSGI